MRLTPTVAVLASLMFVPSTLAEPVDEVFYHFMPIAWRDSDFDPNVAWNAGDPHFGDFDGMTASLDYLEYLGVTAVWMNPIFPSPAYHGYQHGAADTLNPRHGTEGRVHQLPRAGPRPRHQGFRRLRRLRRQPRFDLVSGCLRQSRQPVRRLARLHQRLEHVVSGQQLQHLERRQRRLHPLGPPQRQRRQPRHRLGPILARP